MLGACPYRRTGDHPRIKSAGMLRRDTRWGSAPEQLAHHPGGVVDHRDHPRIVEPGRADHADHADDAARGVVIGRDHGRRAGQRKQLVLRANEDAHALGLLGAAEQLGHLALGLEIVEEEAHARSGSSRTNSMCLSRTLDFAVSTTPAAWVSPDNRPLASLSTFSTDLPEAATFPSIASRSRSVRSPICISASTKKRKPRSVGSRPAEV